MKNPYQSRYFFHNNTIYFFFLYIKTILHTLTHAHTHSDTFIFHLQFQDELHHHGNIIFFFNVCNTDVQDVTNVVPPASWCSLKNKKFGPPAMKNFSLWLDCWGEISQVPRKAKHENILWDCSSLWEGECLAKSELQSISCLWQMWCAGSEPLIKH